MRFVNPALLIECEALSHAILNFIAENSVALDFLHDDSIRLKIATTLTILDDECGHVEPLCNPNRTFEYFFIRTRHTTYAIANPTTKKNTLLKLQTHDFSFTQFSFFRFFFCFSQNNLSGDSINLLITLSFLNIEHAKIIQRLFAFLLAETHCPHNVSAFVGVTHLHGTWISIDTLFIPCHFEVLTHFVFVFVFVFA